MPMLQMIPESILPDIGRNEIQDAKPRHIVECDMKLGYASHQRICEQQESQQSEMHFLVHILCEQIQEWNQQIEYQETGGEARCHTPNRYQHFYHRLQREAVVTREQKHSSYHHIVEFHLQQEFEEFSQRDLLLAHEVASDEYETVDARLAPHTQQIQEKRFS